MPGRFSGSSELGAVKMKNAQMSRRAVKHLVAKVGAAAALVMVSGWASAVGLDITAVTTGITDAQTAVLAIITALLAMSTAIFGLSKVYAFVRRRAGA
jgi:FtsH-binding integral membrane protein